MLIISALMVCCLIGSALAVGEWGQCGGMNYQGSTVCDAGLVCVKKDDWYSQCLKAATSQAPLSAGTVAEWGQCGGANYQGSTTCADGLTCVKIDSWYSQCLRSTSTTSGSSSTTTTKASSTTTTKASSTTTTKASSTTTFGSTTTTKAPTVTSSTSIFSTTTTKTTTTTGSKGQSFLDSCAFGYGRAFDGSVSDYSAYDYITIWLGTNDGSNTDFNKVNSLFSIIFNWEILSLCSLYYFYIYIYILLL